MYQQQNSSTWYSPNTCTVYAYLTSLTLVLWHCLAELICSYSQHYDSTAVHYAHYMDSHTYGIIIK